MAKKTAFTEKCGKCKYFVFDDSDEMNCSGDGWCHRFPPSWHNFHDGYKGYGMPDVCLTTWCGEFMLAKRPVLNRSNIGPQ